MTQRYGRYRGDIADSTATTREGPVSARRATEDRRLFVAATLVAVGASGVALIGAPPEAVFSSSRSVAVPIAGLGTGAALLMLAVSGVFLQRWRVGADEGSLLLGLVAGLMALGSLDLLLAANSATPGRSTATVLTVAAAGRATAAVLFALQVTRWRHDEPSGRHVALVAGACLAAVVATIEFTPMTGPAADGTDLGHFAYVSGMIVPSALLAAGALSLRHGRRHGRLGQLWMGVLAVVVGTADLALHHVDDPTHVDLLGGVGLLTLGAALVAAGFHNDLVRLQAAQIDMLREVEGEVETGRLALEAERNDRAMVAHDGRSALLAIEGGLRYVVASHDADPATTEEVCRALSRELARLRRLLSGPTEAACRPFLVADAIAPAVRLYGLEADLVVDASADVLAYGDPDALREIVQNLLDNAVHHGRSASITLRVKETSDSVGITVSDLGPGVNEMLHDTIFERGVSSKPNDASGLGLYSARELATQMNGSLSIDPVRRGASFTVTLPTRAPAAEPEISSDQVGDHPGVAAIIDLRGAVAR